MLKGFVALDEHSVASSFRSIYDGPIFEFGGDGNGENVMQPGFQEYTACLHANPKEVHFEGLQPYEGTRQQIMLDIDCQNRNTQLPRRMCAIDQAYLSDREWRVAIIRRISETVYYGKMTVYGGQTVEVAIKLGVDFDEKDALIDEAMFYVDKLQGLQGDLVPQYIGTFCCGTPQEDFPTPLAKTCLLLTWVGEPLNCRIQDLEDAETRLVGNLRMFLRFLIVILASGELSSMRPCVFTIMGSNMVIWTKETFESTSQRNVLGSLTSSRHALTNVNILQSDTLIGCLQHGWSIVRNYGTWGL
jgi:hypothetical protein